MPTILARNLHKKTKTKTAGTYWNLGIGSQRIPVRVSFDLVRKSRNANLRSAGLSRNHSSKYTMDNRRYSFTQLFHIITLVSYLAFTVKS
jgi:hypothetical protein